MTADWDVVQGSPAQDAVDSEAVDRDAGAFGASFGVTLRDEIVRQSIDAIIVTDRDLLIRLWNPAAERIYGVPAGDAIGRRLPDVLTALEIDGRPLDGSASRAALDRVGSWRQRVIQRPAIGTRAGRDILIDSVVTRLSGADGRPTGLLGMNRDISDSARIEHEVGALALLTNATDGARTPAQVAAASLEILLRATGADAGLVTSMETGYEALAKTNVSDRTVETILSYGSLSGPIAIALRPAGAWISADVATAPLREDVREAVLADGIKHLVVLGLRPGGRLNGVLALGWLHAAPIEPTRTIMSQAAALVAASIETARLLAAVEAGLAKERLLTRRMGALVELTRMNEVIATDPADADRSGIRHLIAEVGAVIGASGSAYGRVVGTDLVLEVVDQISWEDAAVVMNRPVADLPILAESGVGSRAVLLEDKPGSISETAQRFATKGGYKTGAVFPIHDEAGLSGVIFCALTQTAAEIRNEIDERTLEAIGRVLDISFANQRLREVIWASERQYRDLFDHTPDALLIQSMDDEILDANEAAFALYGRDIVGLHVADLAISEPIVISASAAPLDVVRGTGIGRRRDGSTFPEEVELRVMDLAGKRRTLAMVRDVTERTRMQAELVQAQKMDAIGLLVAGVAHELNNPLAAIVGFSHLLRTDPALPADLRHQAELLVQEANRTRVIVQNLLDFARQRPPERVETDLRSLLDSVLGLQTYVLSRNQMDVEIDIEPDLPRLSVDRSQMQQVLINLTVNATQAIHSLDRPGRIAIRARSVDAIGGGRTVRIEIADDGPGIPPEIVDRLFMPFVTTKEPGEGTGLGLSVSFGIVANHGGTLRHERNAAGGATFSIELPVGLAAAVGAPAPAGSEPTGGGAASSVEPPVKAEPPAEVAQSAEVAAAPEETPRLRVLVLDDEPSIREFLGRVLTRNGHEAVLADSGAVALEIVRSAPPDVILCDHRMAGMNGTEFHAEVMAISPLLARRFAFMSGDVLNPELRAFAEEHGIQLLAKPFDIAAVGAIVSTLVAAEAP